MATTLLRRLHTTLPGWRLRQSLKRHWSTLPGASQIHALESGSCLLSAARLRRLERHLRHVDLAGIPGDIVECGVAAGGSASLLGLCLSRANSLRELWLFDTFDGLPVPSKNDPDYAEASQWVGRCRGTLPDVVALFRRVGVTHPRIHFVPGLFEKTLVPVGLRQIAVAHIDGDWYDSTACCLRALWPLLSPGGRVQIDDYGRWQGCRRAVDEFRVQHPGLTLHDIDGTGVWFERP